MKKIVSILCFALVATTAFAALTGKKIVIDPGHGTFGSNDRPNPTIGIKTPTEDNGGFFESNTNLWKAKELQKKLEAAGAIVTMTREKNGVNPGLSTRAAKASGKDFFISIHSNAATEGTVTNYLYLALRGDGSSTTTIKNKQRAAAEKCWPYVFEFMGESDEGFVHEPHTHYSYTNTKIAPQSLGVMKHSLPGFLSEGFFHTYQPSRQRALSQDWCRQEGLRYYRGIAAYYNHSAETKGYIMGVVKRSDQKMKQSKTLSTTSFYWKDGSHDQYVPCNGAKVYLYNSSKTKLKEYTVDKNYNGIFLFENLAPGTYYLGVNMSGCGNLPDQYREVEVAANKTVYPVCLVKSGTYSQTTEDKFLGVTTTNTPTVKTSAAAISLSAVKGAASPSKAVTITASDLNADLSISVSPAGTITATKASGWNARTGGTLNISSTTGTVGTHEATVTVKSGTASVEIHVTATISEVTTTPPAEEVKKGTVAFKQLWVKKASAATYLNSGTNDNRSMAYYNGSIYIPNKAAGTFTIINAADGSQKGTKTIGTSRFGHHNLRITADGKILLGNTEAATKTVASVAVLGSDVSAGGETALGSATLGGRSDFFYTYGEWNKSGYVIALTNEVDSTDATMAELDMAFVKIPFANGALQTASAVNVRNATLPASYASAKAIPADENSFYASAVGEAPTLHSLTTGDFVDDWGSEKPVQEADYPTSGLGVFAIHGHKYVVTPLNRYGKFEIYEVTYGLSKATKVTEVGTVAEIDRTKGNGLATVDIATAVSGNDVLIYVFAPHNGLAAYKFTFTPDATDTPSTPSTPDVTYGNVNFHFQGGTMAVPADNEGLWNSMWAEFKATYNMIDYNASGFVTPLLSQSGTGYVNGSTDGNEKSIGRFLQNCFYNSANSKYKAIAAAGAATPWSDGGIWEWLGDYIYAVKPAFSGKTLAYVYDIQGFLQKTATLGSYSEVDWTTAGEPENWQAAYTFGHKPTKSGATFLGWFANANGTGTAYTKLPTSGDVYACWSGGGGTTTEIEAVQQEARILPTYSGVEMFFEGTQAVVVYNINGMQVAAGVSTDYFACDLEAGMYIIRIGQEAYKFVK